MHLHCETVSRDVADLMHDKWHPLTLGGRLSFPTSGTTGEKKQVVHDARNIIDNARAFNERVGIDQHVRMYHCLPLEYMGGFLNTIVCPAVAGGFTYIGSEFSPLLFWQEIRESASNAVWLSPTMAAMLTRLYRRCPDAKSLAGGLAHAFCGFAPLPSAVRRDWMDVFGIPLQESYGTSELMLVSVQDKEDAFSEENVGLSLDDIDLAFCAGTRELVVNSPYADPFYAGTDGCMEAMPRINAHIRTGDVGYCDGDKLVITGRIKDFIKRGGETIYPFEIERIVKSIAGVVDAAVVGRPHEFWGETVALFVEYEEYADVYGQCKIKLPQSHWPDEVIFVRELPRTETGKIIKSKLREQIVNAKM